MVTQEDVIKRFKNLHGDTYDYSLVHYTKMEEKVKIICSKHGVFEQTPHSHLKGQGCPKCGVERRSNGRKYNTETFIQKAIEVHGDKYDYSKVEYVDSYKKVCIICPIHGEFWQGPSDHLNGRGCRQCSQEKNAGKHKLTQEEFIERSNKAHNNKYDYSKTEYKKINTPVCIICPKHGEFWQKPQEHMNGHGCQKCAIEYNANNHRKDTEQFIREAKAVHGDKYDYSKTVYRGIYEKLTITCPKHGDFIQRATEHLCGCGCQKCGITTSKKEDEIYEYLCELLGEENVIHGDRTVIKPLEIDIYIPSLKIGIEYNGLYWHNEINKPDINYHLNKTNECKKYGIRLIHIYEDEWNDKKEICKSRLRTIIGKCNNTLYARKCIVKEIDSRTACKFVNENHIQGNTPATIRYGLYYDNELVSVMTFSKPRLAVHGKKEENSYELLRFCNKLDYRVIGGASKLLKHFINDYKPNNIISYADKRWSIGNLYETIGFKLINESKPSYYYVVNEKRYHRFSFRKDILIKKYGCKKEETEHSFCLKNKWYRIYDCGTLKYEIKI